MKEKIILIKCLSLLFILTFSDNQKPKSVTSINLSNQTFRNISLSSLIEEIQYIPLSNDKLLNEISKVKQAQSNFYIIDNKSLLLKFSNNGKFEAQIGRIGNGPGEYLFITDFTIGENSSVTYALISYQKKIFEYTPTGKYIQAINLYIRAQKIAGYNDGFLTFNNISNGDNPISFVLLDLKGNILNQFANKYKFNNGNGRSVRFEGECLFYNFQGKLHLKEIYDDTVFYVENKSMIPKFILNSGKNRFTTEIRKNLNDGNVLYNIVFQSNIFETKNYLFFEYNDQILVYNKKTLESYEISKNVGFINDVDGGPNVVFKTAINDNTLLTWYNAFELKGYVASEAFKSSTPKFPEKKKALEKLANSLNENDNPVLMLVKLKE